MNKSKHMYYHSFIYVITIKNNKKCNYKRLHPPRRGEILRDKINSPVDESGADVKKKKKKKKYH